MAKSLKSMSDAEKRRAIDRRLKEETKGLSFWAAMDAQKHIKK